MSNQIEAEKHLKFGNDLYGQGNYIEACKKYQKAIEKDPNYVDAYNNWGNALYAQKKYEEAIEKYQKAIEKDPNYADAYDNWGLALANLKKYDEAIEKYQKATEKDPNYAAAYNNWGNALYAQKKYEEAIEKYQKAIGIDPDNADAYYNWGLALGSLKRYEEAIEKYQKATEKNPNYADAYNNWGNALYAQKKYDEAIEKYQKAIEKDPNYADAYNNWGLALANLKKYDEAIEKYQEATKKNPNYALAYYNWGNVLYAQKKYEEAIEKYQKAIGIDPDNADAYYNWGLALGSLKRYEEAIEKYQKATEKDPNYTYAYHNTAHILWKQGKYKAAREEWEKTCEVYERTKQKAKDSNNADHFFYYGSVLHEIFGELNKVEEIYNEGLKLNPNHTGILTGLVNLYLEKKDENVKEGITTYWRPEKMDKGEDIDKSSAAYWKARDYYKKAEAILKDQLKKAADARTCLQLGELQLTMLTTEEEYKEAEDNLKKALEGDKESPYADLGVLYSRKEDFKKAVEYFEAAFRQDPDDLTIRSNMAEAYFKQGKAEKAEVEYKRILGITPYHVESLIGLGEVYKVMAENDPDKYYEAISCFTNALRTADSENRSKNLKKKERTAVHYSRGYAESILYESSKFRRDESLIKKALQDFKTCHKIDPNHQKAIQAIQKIEERIGGVFSHQNVAEKVATWGIFILSLLMFIGVQISFYIPIFGKPYIMITEESLANLEEVPDNILDSLNVIKNQKFISSGELLDFLKTNTGIELSESLKSSILKQANSGKSLDNFPKFEPVSYASLSFLSLIFMGIGLYLPQITKIKYGVIELEKSAVDQIKTSGTLGISK